MLTYKTCCVNSTADDIDEMVDNAIDITYETFIKHVSHEEISDMLRYTGSGLHIKNDYAVSFHRSKYQGERCYYVCHSMIEYIWT